MSIKRKKALIYQGNTKKQCFFFNIPTNSRVLLLNFNNVVIDCSLIGDADCYSETKRLSTVSSLHHERNIHKEVPYKMVDKSQRSPTKISTKLIDT